MSRLIIFNGDDESSALEKYLEWINVMHNMLLSQDMVYNGKTDVAKVTYVLKEGSYED